MKVLRLWRSSLSSQSAHVEQTQVSDERFNVCDLRRQENNTLGEADEATILCR
jgi:hypothetical protein